MRFDDALPPKHPLQVEQNAQADGGRWTRISSSAGRCCIVCWERTARVLTLNDHAWRQVMGLCAHPSSKLTTERGCVDATAVLRLQCAQTGIDHGVAEDVTTGIQLLDQDAARLRHWCRT